jgi:ParB-like chromosome segregation protein Spo0J
MPVQQRVAAGVLSAGHARAILSLGDPEAMQRLADKIVNEDPRFALQKRPPRHRMLGARVLRDLRRVRAERTSTKWRSAWATG